VNRSLKIDSRGIAVEHFKIKMPSRKMETLSYAPVSTLQDNDAVDKYEELVREEIDDLLCKQPNATELETLWDITVSKSGLSIVCTEEVAGIISKEWNPKHSIRVTQNVTTRPIYVHN